MGFRSSLNVDGYIERIGWQQGTDEFAPAPVEQSRASRPRLYGRPDQAEASDETALAVYPPVVWDVNGYYALFGIGWPYRHATVAMLRLAYFERGGLDDDRLTYVLQQLRNPAVRREYDAMPLGEPFLDRYVQAWLKARAANQAARQTERTGTVVGADELLRKLGFDLENDHAEESDSAGQDPSSTPPAELSEGSATVLSPWKWAYYLWRSTADDSDRLGRWQELLVKAFSQVGTRRRFCVGFVGRQPHEWVSGEVQGKLVVFLHERVEPTPELAARAVAGIPDEGVA